MIDNPLIVLAFLSLFHLLGGGGLGIALRPLRSGESVNVSLAIWGLGFAGIPLLGSIGAPWLLPFQLLEIVAAGLLTFFFQDRVQELFSNTNVWLIVFGGVFFMAGSGAAGMLLRGGDYAMAALFGLLFGGLGLAILIWGLRRLMGSSTDSEDE